jgi:hypothetical protein
MKHRLFNLLIALDQLAYVMVTLGKGHPDETLSAAAWRTEQDGKILGKFFRPIIDFLFLPFEDNHCFNSYVSEISRNHLPQSYTN